MFYWYLLGFPANETFRKKNAKIFRRISQTCLRNFALFSLHFFCEKIQNFANHNRIVFVIPFSVQSKQNLPNLIKNREKELLGFWTLEPLKAEDFSYTRKEIPNFWKQLFVILSNHTPFLGSWEVPQTNRKQKNRHTNII